MITHYCLVSTYVVCERLSVMHRQARFPEIFDQIVHPCSGIRFQNTPSQNFKTLIFFPESKSDLFHNTPPENLKTLIFFPESKSDLFHNTPHRKFENFPESKSDLFHNTPQNFKTLVFFPHGSWSMFSSCKCIQQGCFSCSAFYVHISCCIY